MKNAAMVAFVCLLVMSVATCGYCDNGPIKKLGRGISNMLTFPLEIPNRIGAEREGMSIVARGAYNILETTVMMGARLAAGAFEVMTFPIPYPPKYEPLINDPEYLWDWKKEK